jgi:hypothetical protein
LTTPEEGKEDTQGKCCSTTHWLRIYTPYTRHPCDAEFFFIDSVQ